MANYGAKISKLGYNASDIPTESTKRNFTILDTSEAHKVLYKGYVTSGSYTHNLGGRPSFYVFATDSATTPTYFSPSDQAMSTTTTIENLPNPCYLIVFHERV